MPGPVDTLSEPLLGPRSACVGSTDDSMAAVIAADQYGNAPADGTPIDLNIAYPDGTSATEELALRSGLAWANVQGRTRAGIIEVGATAKRVVSSRADMNVAACAPSPFGLSAEPAGLPADGRQVLTLRTAPIVDRYDNPMPDGTLVTFLVTTPAGELRLPAQTISGVAEVSLRAPGEPGVATARALILGVKSEPLTITFRPAGGP
jgi:hypothetical protein